MLGLTVILTEPGVCPWTLPSMTLATLGSDTLTLAMVRSVTSNIVVRLIK